MWPSFLLFDLFSIASFIVMRFEGTVRSWNEDRAFGFIESTQGGPAIFLHITARPARSGRPSLNQRVTFEIETTRDGKKRAKNARLASANRPDRPRVRNQAAQWGGATLFAVPAFMIFYGVLAFFWHRPRVVALAYVTLSFICFMAYAIDKSAATAGRWRTKESSLLMLGLIGGWPGGLLAQQILRHKSSKASFRAAFWGTVLLNVVAFTALSSPWLDGWSHLK